MITVFQQFFKFFCNVPNIGNNRINFFLFRFICKSSFAMFLNLTVSFFLFLSFVSKKQPINMDHSWLIQKSYFISALNKQVFICSFVNILDNQQYVVRYSFSLRTWIQNENEKIKVGIL